MRTDPPSALEASWAQLELAVRRLHEAAREPLSVREFYRRVLEEATEALGAHAAAAWRPRDDGRPELIARIGHADSQRESDAQRPLAAALAGGAASVVRAPATDATGADDCDLVLCPIPRPARDAGEPPGAAAALGLWLPAASHPAMRQGWLEFAATLADVAADFHAWNELRDLRGAATLGRQAVDLMRRVHRPRDVSAAAFELANEGRRLLGCDRLAVLVRRGDRWRLAAVSGVDRVERRTELARHCETLARSAAAWGETVDYSAGRTTPSSGSEWADASPADALAWPPQLSGAVQTHVDASHARRLVAAPIAFPVDAAARPRRGPAFDLVLVAECFDAAGPDALRSRTVELGELCAPALARAVELDRFPLRPARRWAERLEALRQPRRALRTAAWLAAAVGVVAALTLVPCDFAVEAPARLAAGVQRDVFATASGAVAEVRVHHGQTVAAGEVLAVLSDPQLALELQQTRGAVDAARKRLEAINLARTDRTLRDDDADQRLPLSAEQRELQERVASLERQRELLEARTAELVLRSPLPGTVLTLDVQRLLESRPVERGQVLLTIADASAGWELRAETAQRDVGHVLEAHARAADGGPLRASCRLAGDVDAAYSGHVVEIAAAAPLDADRLHDEPAPVVVRIALDDPAPEAARPGMNATVRIHCGRRSLGYVWLHDVWATLYRWATF